MVHEHTITLIGERARDRGLSGHVLRDLFRVLIDGSEQSLRFRLEGRSTARGTPPAWLRPASDFQMVELSRTNDSQTLRLEARALVDSMPDKFQQADLFDDLDPKQSPLELFEDALEEALAERADSDAFDQPLLETCSEFRSLLASGLEAVEIRNGRTVRVDRETIEHVVRLSKSAYPERKVRLAGKLDIIRYSDCRFTLVLASGAKVAGAARDLGAETLRAAFGKNVVVTGTAEFRPSGRLLRIDADHVEDATEGDLHLFTSVPRPLLGPQVVERAPEKKGLATLLGEWPGDEPLETLLGQLGRTA